MEGPMVIKRAYSGTLAWIQTPASRPPGTPPVPARNMAEVSGWICFQLADPSEKTTTPADSQDRMDLPGQPGYRLSKPNNGSELESMAHFPNKRPAKRATAGAMGSRY